MRSFAKRLFLRVEWTLRQCNVWQTLNRKGLHIGLWLARQQRKYLELGTQMACKVGPPWPRVTLRDTKHQQNHKWGTHDYGPYYIRDKHVGSNQQWDPGSWGCLRNTKRQQGPLLEGCPVTKVSPLRYEVTTCKVTNNIYRLAQHNPIQCSTGLLIREAPASTILPNSISVFVCWKFWP